MVKETKVLEAEVKEFNEKDLTITHFISTERKDRGGDIMRADGMKILGRPVVLMSHGYSKFGQEPIAKPIWIKKGEFKNRKGIMAKTQFFPDEDGQRLWTKATQNYMPNWSIGYIVLKKEDFKDGEGYGRDITEWELLEYSPVGVPMNPDAQAVVEKGQEAAWFKFASPGESLPNEYKSLETIEEEKKEEKYGDLCEYKDGVLVDMEGKPYPNEHACRLEDPGKYIRIRRQNNKFGQGIHAIWGVQGGGKPVELQAIRFSKEKFTAAEARAWIKDHKYKCKLFEPASQKCETCGETMTIAWDQDISGEKCIITCEEATKFHYICPNTACRRAETLNLCYGNHDATVYREKDDKFWCVVCDREVEVKTVIPYRKYSLAPEKEAWDAGAEVKKADVKALKIMCTWFDGTKPDLKTSYKLPHHKADGYSTVWNGIRAAAAAVMGARGGTSIPDNEMQGVKNHLGRHYQDFDKGDPPWKKKKGMEFLEILPTLKEEKEIHQRALDLIPEVADFFEPEGEKFETLYPEMWKRLERLEKRFEDLFGPLSKSVDDLVQALSAKLVAEKKDNQKDDNPPVGERVVVLAPEEKKEPTISIDPEELGKTIRETISTDLRTAFNKLTGKVD